MKKKNIMGFTDFIKKAVFEEEGKKEIQKPIEQVVSSPSPVPVSPLPAPEPERKTESLLDEEMLKKLEKRLRDENLPGPDYLELKEAAEDEELVKDEPDEARRYRQAYKNMKRFFPDAKVNKQSILSAVDHYIAVIEKQQKDGMEELAVKKSANIDEEEKAVSKLSEEISALEERLQKLKDERGKKNEKILKSRSEFDLKEAKFKANVGYVLSVLKQDKEKLNTYLND